MAVSPHGKFSESLSNIGVWNAGSKRHKISPSVMAIERENLAEGRAIEVHDRLDSPDYWDIRGQSLTLFSTQPQTSSMLEYLF